MNRVSLQQAKDDLPAEISNGDCLESKLKALRLEKEQMLLDHQNALRNLKQDNESTLLGLKQDNAKLFAEHISLQDHVASSEEAIKTCEEQTDSQI